MKRIVWFLALAIAVPAGAQAPAQPSAGSAVGTLRGLWRQVATYIVQAAEDMPEADYAFRPTPEVRSFGELIGHVAGAQYMMCGAALNEAQRSEDDIEKTKTTKAELVAALRASTEYCTRAYAQSDAEAQGKTTLFGREQSRLLALAINATHDNEHYGNIVTYMRLKGMVPPSSRRTP